MRNYHFSRPLGLAFILTTSLASAQNEPERFSGLKPEFAEGPPLNRLSLSYRPGFNITAKFKNQSLSPALNPGPAIAGVDHNYDNGYNRVDQSGNAGAET